jgi:2,4-dichlorophenol 6-monooxygenase
MRCVEVPVLIVGGGGTGLSASIFLTHLGIESLLVERHQGTSVVPKAHYFNQRTMEIYKLSGVADSIYAKSAPRDNLGKIIWMTSLGGGGALDGLTIAEVDIMGGGGVRETYDKKGFTHPTHISQHGLEAILREWAEGREARLLFRHECESFVQDASGVTTLIKDGCTGEQIEVRSQYVLAADGGRTIGPQLGIEMHGQRGMADFITVWFSADLSELIKNDRAVMRMFVHPERPQNGRYAGALLTLGPNRWDRHSETWEAIWMTSLNDPEQLGMNNAADAVHQFFKFDEPIEVKYVSHWTLETVVAERFSEGRVFLIGDAAHRQTPGAGIGLNSGIQDAHNIAWKLALMLRGVAGSALLDSYELERRPVVQRNVAWSLFAMSNMALPMLAMGLSPVMPKEINEHEFAKLFETTLEGDARRARLAEVFKTQRIEYSAHDLEMGFTYKSNAIVDDGSSPAWRDPMGAEYRPTTRPGSRMPHVWLEVAGARRSTHELIPAAGFLLLTGRSGDPWCRAAKEAADELGLVVATYKVSEGGDANDPNQIWEHLRGIDDDGAVVVRPDGHVAFRSRHGVANALSTLLTVLKAATGRDSPPAARDPAIAGTQTA